MSQIGKAIMAIKHLFDRSQYKEQGLLLKKDKELFIAAYKFNKLIEDFERREPAWTDEIRNEYTEELAHIAKQNDGASKATTKGSTRAAIIVRDKSGKEKKITVATKSKQPPDPSSLRLKIYEEALQKEAASMRPEELKKEIEVLRKLEKKCPSAAVKIRLWAFNDVYVRRDDCGPTGREIRVPQTS